MTAPPDTAFTRLVGCRVPIQLAVMGGGIGTPELAVAVSRAGGLGMLSSTNLVSLDEQLRVASDATDAPVGVGFFAFDVAQVGAAAQRVRVVDVFWGDPDPGVVARIHDGRALACWQVGSVDEARAAVDAGCDLVVAQGVEAGGHVRGTVPLRELLDAVAAVVDVPVIAAGGIATGAALRAVLDAGASAARIGTRFIATRESGAHPAYVRALLAASRAEDTVLTTAFGLEWPDAPHRVLRSCAESAPGEGPWSALPPLASSTGDISAMAMYAGCGVGEIHDVPSATEIVDRLVADAFPP